MRLCLIVRFFLCPFHRWWGCKMLLLVDPAGESLTVVMQQLFDKVDVGENHSSAAIPLELELVEGLTGMWVRDERERKGSTRTLR